MNKQYTGKDYSKTQSTEKLTPENIEEVVENNIYRVLYMVIFYSYTLYPLFSMLLYTITYYNYTLYNRIYTLT